MWSSPEEKVAVLQTLDETKLLQILDVTRLGDSKKTIPESLTTALSNHVEDWVKAEAMAGKRVNIDLKKFGLDRPAAVIAEEQRAMTKETAQKQLAALSTILLLRERGSVLSNHVAQYTNDHVAEWVSELRAYRAVQAIVGTSEGLQAIQIDFLREKLLRNVGATIIDYAEARIYPPKPLKTTEALDAYAHYLREYGARAKAEFNMMLIAQNDRSNLGLVEELRRVRFDLAQMLA